MLKLKINSFSEKAFLFLFVFYVFIIALQANSHLTVEDAAIH